MEMNILDVVLKDDGTNEGGLPHSEYTASEFIAETELFGHDNRMLTHNEFDMLNKALIEAGIQPLTSVHYDIRIVRSRNGFIRMSHCGEPTVE